MGNFRFSQVPISIKLFVTVLLCMAGLVYCTLLLQIWQDTQMKPSMIAEGYCTMEAMELTHHSHVYLPYYTFYIFALPVAIFMFTAYSEKIKRMLAVLPFIVIIIDIGSMWLIPYCSKGVFCWVLWLAGTCLGLTFLSLFLLNLYDIWLRKAQP